MTWLNTMWALLQLALWVFQKLQERQLISQGHAEALKNLLEQSNALVTQIDLERKSALSGVAVSDEFNRDGGSEQDIKSDHMPVILPSVFQSGEGQPGNDSSTTPKQSNLDKSGV